MKMNVNDKRRLQQFRKLCCKITKTDSPPTVDGDTRFGNKPPFVSVEPTSMKETPLPSFVDPPLVPIDLRETPFPQFPIADPTDPDLKTIFPYDEPPGSVVTFQSNPPLPKDIIDNTPIPPNPPDDPPDIVPLPPPPPPSSLCPQYHPSNTVPGIKSQFDIVNDITAYVNTKGFRHDPDGIPWIPRNHWVPWDGVTTVNPCSATKEQIQRHVFPMGINTMRGLREVFYSINPFRDNSNPTVSEIENWNIEVIRHFRKLLGYSEVTHPVSNHKCTYLKAAWSEERFRTTHWTSLYPGRQDSSSGPCTIPISSNAHCGGGFMLNASDQTPYLCPPTMAPCGNSSGAEGVSNHNTDIPWSVKLNRIIGSYLNSDGIGAHTGPFVGREYFGTAWYVPPGQPGSLSVRTKWSGKNNFVC